MRIFIFRPIVHEKTNLTAADVGILSEEFQINSSNYDITRLFFSHAQESLYVIDTKTSDISELRKQYNIEENDTLGRNIVFTNKNVSNIECIITEKEDAIYDVSFYYYGDNRKFDKILGNNRFLETLIKILP